MTVYLVHLSPALVEPLSGYLADTFESIRVSDTTWFIATDMDMDELDDEFADIVDDTELMLVIEVSGDFSMQGLPDEQMTWIDEHSAS